MHALKWMPVHSETAQGYIAALLMFSVLRKTSCTLSMAMPDLTLGSLSNGPVALAGCAANQWRSLHWNAGGMYYSYGFLIAHKVEDKYFVKMQDRCWYAGIRGKLQSVIPS